MGTKEQCVKGFLKATFPKKCGGKSRETIWLPSILSIIADLMDVHSSSDNEKNCEIVTLKYEEEERLFCIYDQKHIKIYDPPQKLPKELQINNKSIINEWQPAITIELEGFTIIQHFFEELRDQHGRQITSYIEILSTLFFFCPNILWVAIQHEFETKTLDKSMLKAIHNCLSFYIILEVAEIEVEGKVTENSNIVLRTINNAKLMPQIEEVVIGWTTDPKKGESERKDHLVKLVNMASDGIQIIREKLTNTIVAKKKLKKVLGVKNYKRLLHYNDNTY